MFAHHAFHISLGLVVGCILLCTVHCSPTKPLPLTIKPRRDEAATLFDQQMHNPSEVFSVVLLIGGDTVLKAIAQISGRKVTLVSFSFGWVAYAFNALTSAFGDGTFMPSPDTPGSVIVMGSRNKKSNNSWVLGRLIRDLEQEIEKELKTPIWENPLKNTINEPKILSRKDSGLLISVYKALPGGKRPDIDNIFKSFFVFLLLQLAVAAVPTITHRDWSIISMTAIGTLLAITTGSLREWRLEKYSCRENSKQSYILTRGNGHRHVFVVLDESHSGLFLDDLAGAVSHATTRTRIASVILAILWIAFLIVAGGLKDHTWYLLAVGALGMVQNVAVAGMHRTPHAHGIPLSPKIETLGMRDQDKGRPKVMQVLFDAEAKYPGLGLAIRPEFFQDFAMLPIEVKKWEEMESTLKQRRQDQRRQAQK